MNSQTPAVVPINPELSAPEMEYIVRDCEARHVFYHASLEHKVLQVRDGLASPGIAFADLQPLVAADSRREATNDSTTDLEQTDEAVIIYTSGTSGNPKGVVLCHLNLLADAKAEDQTAGALNRRLGDFKGLTDAGVVAEVFGVEMLVVEEDAHSLRSGALLN